MLKPCQQVRYILCFKINANKLFISVSERYNLWGNFSSEEISSKLVDKLITSRARDLGRDRESEAPDGVAEYFQWRGNGL